MIFIEPNVAAKILVVDDSPDSLELLRGLLEAQGHKVRLAATGNLALELARAEPPDLILLDIGMPEMNGYEVCQILRSEPALQSVPVLFLSAMAGAADKLRAFQAGGVDYITKPFEIEEVAARVRTQLELRRQRRALQANYGRLKELEQLRDNLVHMIVHDLRSSLTGIRLSLDLLGESISPTDSKGAGLLGKAQTGVDRLSEMTAQLLDISRLEAGQMPLNKVESDLGQTALAAIESISAWVSGPRWRWEAPAPVRLLHDREIIRRVIENLLGNALKFAPRESELKVAITRDGTTARVSVTDSGPGIPPASQRKIFEKFAQLSPENRALGAGLGLAFCKLAVEAHGGRIGVTSQPGQGSTFWFTLPLGT
jgi:two-component system sensor histidine kinase/response regulator